jgi:hypothetical protein
MANLLPQPGHGGLPLAVPAHQDFRAFYGDPTLDPCNGDYSQIMNRFDPEITPAISHATLLEQALGLGPVPQAYLCCTHRQNQTRVFCLHLPMKYASALDGRTTPWDGQTFVYLGEAIQGQATTVILPAEACWPIYNVRAYSTEYVLNHLNDFGPFGLPYPGVNEAESAETTVRSMIYLPARYVPHMLNPSGYNLR